MNIRKTDIQKIPANAKAPEIKILAEKINILIDKSNEADRCIEKIIGILMDMTIMEFKRDIAFIEFKKMIDKK